MKNLNLDEHQKEESVMIVRATLTIMDRRTGSIEDRDYYRAGGEFPFSRISRELDSYGYDVIGYKDATYAEGTIDYELLFASLVAQETEA